MDRKLKHLEFIQGVINRLSTNSFLLKGWSVVLVSALFALSAKDTIVAFVYLSYIPAIAFWGLDGYFLSEERKYRKLYEKISIKKPEDIDFFMNTREFDKIKEVSWASSTLSKTLIPFHGTLIGAIIVVMIIQILR